MYAHHEHHQFRGHVRGEFRGGFGPGFDPRLGGFPGPMGPGRRGRPFGRGGRGRRGDVRAAILLLLSEQPMHGYDLIQQISDRSDGLWKPSPGSIYPALSQLEDEGLVVFDRRDGRKYATLTTEGETYVSEQKEAIGDPFAEVRSGVGDEALDLRDLTMQLHGAVQQVARAGTADQVKRAGEALAQARRAIYRILAEDEAEDTPID